MQSVRANTRLVTEQAVAFCDQVGANHCSLSLYCLFTCCRETTHRSKVCYIHEHPQVSNRDGQNYPQGYSTQPTHTTAHCQSTAATHFNEFLLYNLAHMSSSVCTWGWVSALQIRRVRKLTAELWFLSLASNWNTPTVLQTIVFIFTIHPMTCEGFSFFKIVSHQNAWCDFYILCHHFWFFKLHHLSFACCHVGFAAKSENICREQSFQSTLAHVNPYKLHGWSLLHAIFSLKILSSNLQRFARHRRKQVLEK